MSELGVLVLFAVLYGVLVVFGIVFAVCLVRLDRRTVETLGVLKNIEWYSTPTRK